MHDRFSNFFVFDSQFGLDDQSPGDIIYYLSIDDKVNQDVNRRFIITGICTAILNLCMNFNTTSSCDYLITDNREMSFLPIGDGLYFFISLKIKNSSISSCFTSAMMSMAPLNKGFYRNDTLLSPFQSGTTNSRKQILQNVLQTIKKVLFLNVEKPKRDDKSGKFSDSFKNSVSFYMPIILELFDWNDLSISQLWRTSVFLNKLPTYVNSDFRKELESITLKNDFIYGLILCNKNQVVAHTTEPELTNILALLVLKKYKVYYPYSVKEKENELHWTIGFNFGAENGNSYNCNSATFKSLFFNTYWNKSAKNKKDFFNVITPPLIWNDKTLALAALKYNQVVLIIVFHPSQINVEKDLEDFKNLVSHILINCDSFNNENKTENEDFSDEIDSRFKKKAGAKLFCNFKKGKIQLLMNRIQNTDFDLIKYGIVFANETNFFIRSELMINKLINEKKISIINEDGDKNSLDRSLQYNDDEISDFILFKSESNDEKLKKKKNEKLFVHTKSLIPMNSGFYLYFEQKDEKFTNVFIRNIFNKQKGISGALDHCHAIDDCI